MVKNAIQRKSIKQHACKDFLGNASQCDCERDKNM